MTVSNLAAQRVGDAEWVIDESKMDPAYSEMQEWAKAGVQGGIPAVSVYKSIDNTADLQNEINLCSLNGGGALLLQEGEYLISSVINMKSNVVLRASENSNVKLIVTFRAWNSNVKYAFQFSNVKHAGFENIHIELDGPDGVDPVDGEPWNTGGWCGECYSNNPSGHSDLWVGLVKISANSKNNWISDCTLYKSGTNPLLIEGSNNTIRNTLVDRCYNKGGGGAGYVDVRGKYNLFYKFKVKRIRHWAFQWGAKYNVSYKCYSEVDINFHQKDEGYNLFQENTLRIAYRHGWGTFTAGDPNMHGKPGSNNLIYKNDCIYRWYGAKHSDPNMIYTYENYVAKVSELPLPKHGTLYSMMMQNIPLSIEKKQSDKVTISYVGESAIKVFMSDQLNEKINFDFYDMNGRLVKNAVIDHTQVINCSDFQSGIYVCRYAVKGIAYAKKIRFL